MDLRGEDTRLLVWGQVELCRVMGWIQEGFLKHPS